jgi:2-isopropylmalate synthase
MELGFSDLTDEQIENFVDRFKRLADEKKIVTDADMEAIVSDELYKPEPIWTLRSVHVTAGNLLKPTATVSMENKEGEEVHVAEIGAGPVDAVFKCIKKIIQSPTSLIEYKVSSITQGTSAVGSVSVTIQPQEMDQDNQNTKSGGEESNKVHPQTGDVSQKLYTGSGTDIDILVASAQAYVNAFNKLIQSQERDRARQQRLAEGEVAAGK